MAFDYQQWLPTWYDPALRYPTATYSPEAEFVNAVSAAMPYMSPSDYRPWMAFLRAQAPGTFAYSPEMTAQMQVPRMLPEAYAPYQTAGRVEQAREALMGGERPLIAESSPVRQWVDAVMGAAQTFGYGGEQSPWGTPTRRQRLEYMRTMGSPETQSGILGTPQGFGVSEEQAALWTPWLEQFIAPTQEKAPTWLPQNAPNWLTESATVGPRTSVRRGGTWANPRWL